LGQEKSAKNNAIWIPDDNIITKNYSFGQFQEAELFLVHQRVQFALRLWAVS